MSLIRLGREYAQPERPTPMNEPAQNGSGKIDKLESLIKYIPTETITLYVAAVAALSPAPDAWKGTAQVIVYLASAALTPGILYLVAKNQFKKAQPGGKMPWPRFRMAAATVSFLLWGSSVLPPISEFIKPLTGVIAAFASTLFPLLEPQFDDQGTST